MLRALFLIVYMAMNRDTLSGLARLDWQFAMFNAGLVCVCAAVWVIRHFVRITKKVQAGRDAAANVCGTNMADGRTGS